MNLLCLASITFKAVLYNVVYRICYVYSVQIGFIEVDEALDDHEVSNLIRQRNEVYGVSPLC